METGKVKKKLTGIVYKINEGLWQARIYDGWYIGWGTTKEKAIKQCEDNYYKTKEDKRFR